MNRPLYLLLACSALAPVACESGGSTETEPVCEGEGVICNYLGNGESGLGEDGQSPSEVSLYLPQDLTFGPDDQPYVLDWNNHRIRTVIDDKVQTVIGTGYLGDAPDGPARESSLNHPTHVLFDDRGGMIISAWHNSKLMRYDPSDETVTTMCGTGGRAYGGDDGAATKAILDLPVATALDSRGRLYLMDQANQRIRRIDESDVISTVVGPNAAFEPAPPGTKAVCSDDPMTGARSCKLCLEAEAADPMCAQRKPQGYQGDDGPGGDVLMYQPFSQSAPPVGRMEMGANDVLYFCDTGNHRVRAYDIESDTVTTVAGSGPAEYDPDKFKGGYEGDGGPATEALLRSPTDVAVRPKDGALFIADNKNSCVRMVDKKGNIKTVAGKCGKRGDDGDGGPATEALLNQPYGITLGPDGNLYIADTHNHRIRVVYGPF
jgi:sugar lactone lactonase YvrE